VSARINTVGQFPRIGKSANGCSRNFTWPKAWIDWPINRHPGGARHHRGLLFGYIKNTYVFRGPATNGGFPGLDRHVHYRGGYVGPERICIRISEKVCLLKQVAPLTDLLPPILPTFSPPYSASPPDELEIFVVMDSSTNEDADHDDLRQHFAVDDEYPEVVPFPISVDEIQSWPLDTPTDSSS
jgi:hypothetical protein